MSQRWAVLTTTGRNLRLYGFENRLQIAREIAPDKIVTAERAGWWDPKGGLERPDWDGTTLQEGPMKGRKP